MPSLQTLVLEGNKLNGTIPSEIAMSTSLGGLFLSDNELSGTIPSELADMVGLREFIVYPTTLSNFSNFAPLQRPFG